jgi:uncharacterized protein (DUF2147 family)
MTIAPRICIALFALTTGVALADQATGGPPPDPTGIWLVANRAATIRIANCDGRLWGVIASEKKAGVDSKNRDPKLRMRPTLGMPILLGMTRADGNKCDRQIYNAEDGRTYSVNVNLVNAMPCACRAASSAF